LRRRVHATTNDENNEHDDADADEKDTVINAKKERFEVLKKL
jgi:hypothetical protein